MNFAAQLYRLHEAAQELCDESALDLIRLAMCLPGLRKQVFGRGRALTIFLPRTVPSQEILAAIAQRGQPTLFQAFCLLHVVPGRICLRAWERFVIGADGSGSGHVQVANPELLGGLPRSVLGTVRSAARALGGDVVVHAADLDYGSLADLLDALAGPAAPRGA